MSGRLRRSQGIVFAESLTFVDREPRLRPLKRFLPLILIVLAIIVIFATGWNRYLSLDTLRDHGAQLTALVDRHYWLMLIALMALFAVLTTSVVPGVVFITVTAGYLFGPWVGGIATAAAATLGAVGIYYVGRTAFGERLKQKAAQDTGLLNRICAGVDRNTFWYVLTARLIVSVPFHMINVAAGIMSAPLKPYIVATFIGLLPAHIIYCWIGSGLHEVLVNDPNPDIQGLFKAFFWPLMGVGFLSMALPLGMRAFQNRKSAGGEP